MDGNGPSTFFRIVELDSVDSTNEEAKRRSLAGAPEGLVVWARQQTAGRGRHGRSWLSPAGNLYISCVLRPPCAVADAPQIGFVAGIAVAATVRDLLPHKREDVTCKWPNDVLVGGRKIAGLLLESSADASGRIAWIVLGIGLNVAWRPDDIAGAYPATSLAGEGAATTDLGTILTRLCWSVQDGLEVWRHQGFETIRARWLDAAFGRNQRVSVRLGSETVSGVFVGLDATGAMVLSQEGARERIIHAGDVFPTNVATGGHRG